MSAIDLDDPVELLASQREGLLHEDGLTRLQSTADQVRMRVMTGHDEDRVQFLSSSTASAFVDAVVKPNRRWALTAESDRVVATWAR